MTEEEKDGNALGWIVRLTMFFGFCVLVAAFYEGNTDFTAWKMETKTTVITITVLFAILFN